MNQNLKLFASTIHSYKFYNPKGVFGSPNKILYYLENLFQGIEFKNKNVLDVGAGFGMFSIYMSLMGAKKVVSLEPELEGGTSIMINTFNMLIKILNIKNIEIRKEIFQDYEPKENSFDIILFHNSINHLNEQACIDYRKSEVSANIYKDYASKIYKMQSKNGLLIIADCSSSNFYNDLGMKNFFNPSIEWQKHQKSEIWINLFQSLNYKHVFTSWTTPGVFPLIEKIILNNKLFQYFTFSHFRIRFQK